MSVIPVGRGADGVASNGAAGTARARPIEAQPRPPVERERKRGLASRLRDLIDRSPLGGARRLVGRWRYSLMLLNNYRGDFARYRRHASILEYRRHPHKLKARIMLWTHSLEKGLAMPEPRPGWGREVADTLVRAIGEYLAAHEPDDTIARSLRVLTTYCETHRRNGIDVERIAQATDRLSERLGGLATVLAYQGVKRFRRDEFLAASTAAFPTLARSRVSLRDFTDEPVDRDAIREAVAIAVRTPSVCNRQAWRVHCFQGAAGQHALRFQTGNRGFGHRVGTVLLVTGDLNYFAAIGERNQVFIDGGMFGMSLVYALQSRGLGTCMLNLSFTVQQDAALRNAAGVPDNETFIFMIAVGHVPEQCVVAESGRRPADELITFHGEGAE